MRLTTTEAAKALNVHPRTIAKWCVSGKLSGTKKNNAWLVDSASVENLQTIFASGAVCLNCGRHRGPGKQFPLCTKCQMKRNNKNPFWRQGMRR